MTLVSEPLKELASTNYKYTKGAVGKQQAAGAIDPATNCVALMQVVQRFTWGIKALSSCRGLKSW